MIEFSSLKYTNDKDAYFIECQQKGKIIIDGNSVNEPISIKIGDDCFVECLLLNDNEHLISFDINNNAFLKLNVFTKNNAKDGKLVLNLFDNARLEVAYADFSYGKKELNAVVNLNGNNASVNWNLASLSQNKDFKNYSVNFNHNTQDTYANMVNYGVCKDQASLYFLGDAIINRGAIKSSTKQSAKILVFDETCHAKASPKLCIYENDVSASHGASEGQINKDHIFYLMSRGISEDEAKRLIIFGYLYPIISFFDDESIKKDIEDCIVKRV